MTVIIREITTFTISGPINETAHVFAWLAENAPTAHLFDCKTRSPWPNEAFGMFEFRVRFLRDADAVHFKLTFGGDDQ